MISTRLPTVVELEKSAEAFSFVIPHIIHKKNMFYAVKYNLNCPHETIQSTCTGTGIQNCRWML